jgi:hypothetical protein
MRARTVTPRRAAYGSSARYQVRESWVSTPTAENYFLNLRYDSGLTEHLVWIGAGGWARNPPAGIRDRLHASLGLGWYWLRGAEIQVRTDLGAGHQRDRLVAPRPGERKGYSTASLATRLEGKAGQGAAYSSDLAFTFNLSEERAWQGVWRTALTFNLRTFLAVKLGYDLTYTNRPPDAQVDLYGTPGDQAPLGTVPFPVRRLDTLLTTSLVVTF